MLRIATSLFRAGNEVLLVGREKRNSPPLVNQPFEQKRLKCFFEKGKFFYIEFNIRLFFFLLFQKADCFSAADLDTIGAVVSVAKLKGAKSVFDAHEHFTEVPEVVNRKLIKKIWESAAHFFIPKTNAAYTVCNELAEIFQKEYGKKFAVVRNLPFRIEQAHTETSNKNFTLIYQGALNEGRGLEALLEAMVLLPDVHLHIAGEGDLSESLRLKAASLNLTTRVFFLGYITPKELKLLTDKADIGINLLENKGLSYYYSLANKFFDYIQAGKPSLNMDFPEYAFLNRKYNVSILLKSLNPTEIAESVKHLQDRNIYTRLHQNCLKAAEDLCWEKEEGILTQIYHDL
jgi:glycosyltransferase involved in cell wall biosynthesis